MARSVNILFRRHDGLKGALFVLNSGIVENVVVGNQLALTGENRPLVGELSDDRSSDSSGLHRDPASGGDLSVGGDSENGRHDCCID